MDLPKASDVVVDDGLVILTVDVDFIVSVVLIGCANSVETLLSVCSRLLVEVDMLVGEPVQLNMKTHI